MTVAHGLPFPITAPATRLARIPLPKSFFATATAFIPSTAAAADLWLGGKWMDVDRRTTRDDVGQTGAFDASVG